MFDSLSPPACAQPTPSLADRCHVPASGGARPGPCDAWFGPGALAHWTAPVAPPRSCRVRRLATLVREGEIARCLYIVQAGDFKVTRTAEDGYAQVIDFVSVSEAIGLDALATGRSQANARALQDSTVLAVPLDDLAALREANPTFDVQLQAALSAQWRRMRDMAWLMGAVGADRRTARFLLQLADRSARRGLSPRRLLLHMSRRDIAAHLGLAHESISRALSALADSGHLRVQGREIEIIDSDALAELASNTRGHAGEADTMRPAWRSRAASPLPA